MVVLSNDELIKLRSRLYRGYRAPQAVSEYYSRERIESMTRDPAGNLTQMVQSITYEDGTKVTKTTDFALDANGNISGTTITYNYDDTTP